MQSSQPILIFHVLGKRGLDDIDEAGASIRVTTKYHVASVQCVSRDAKILRQWCCLISILVCGMIQLYECKLQADAYLTALKVLAITEGVGDGHQTKGGSTRRSATKSLQTPVPGKALPPLLKTMMPRSRAMYPFMSPQSGMSVSTYGLVILVSLPCK